MMAATMAIFGREQAQSVKVQGQNAGGRDRWWRREFAIGASCDDLNSKARSDVQPPRSRPRTVKSVCGVFYLPPAAEPNPEQEIDLLAIHSGD
jgi:hypothetical protein